MDTVERTSTDQISTVYDGFISYSHAADDLLAPRLQAALQRFAKPWWRRRALRIFRDESSLSANPHLWSSITEALDGSDWFVLLLSPDAARSEWVNQEIEYWIEHKDPSRILPVVTDGEFGWDGDVASDSVPDALRGVFTEEPRWVDLRFARDEEQLDLKNPRFSSAVADIASALRGVPKDELESEEVKQHRRTIRTAWAGVAAIAVLAVAATLFGIQSAENAREAETQRIAAEIEADRANTEADRADANAEAEAEARAEAEESANLAVQNEQLAESRGLAASAIAVLDDDPELSILLALHAIDRTPDGRDTPLEAVNALWRAGSSNRLVDVYDAQPFTLIDLSADGTLLAVSGAQELRMLNAETGDVLWSYTENTVDFFDFVDIGLDGRVAVGILDSRADTAPYESDATDDLPNRIAILDADGGLIQTLIYEDCLGVTHPEWSPDGRFLAISSGLNQDGGGGPGCDRGDGVPYWVEVVDTRSWEAVAVLSSGTTGFESHGLWDETGALHVFQAVGPIRSFEPITFEERPPSGASGTGTVSPRGDRYLTGAILENTPGTFTSQYLVDAGTGALIDILYNEGDFPSGDGAIRFSPDGALAIVGTQGSHTYIYDLPSDELAHRIATGPVWGVAYDPATGRLYTSGTEPGVKVWDLEGSSVSVTPTIDRGEFTWMNGNSIEVGPHAAAIDTLDPTDTTMWKVWLFDPATGELVAESPDGMAIPRPLSDGRWVVFDVDNVPSVWNPATGGVVQLVTCEVTVEDDAGNTGCGGENEPWGYQVIVTPDGDRILLYGDDDPNPPIDYSGHFRVLDAATGALVASADPGADPGPADPFARRPNDWLLNPQHVIQGPSWVLGRTNSGTLAYDTVSGDLLYQGLTGSNEASPSFEVVATSSGTQAVILDTTTRPWTEIASVTTDDRIRGLAFNADGSKLAVGDASTLYVVDTATWLVAQQVKMPNVSDIHWIDDETVVIGTATGLFGTVSLSTDRLLSETRAGLLRSFTDQECARYRIDPCPALDDLQGR